MSSRKHSQKSSDKTPQCFCRESQHFHLPTRLNKLHLGTLIRTVIQITFWTITTVRFFCQCN